jgi:hypothetical protein
MARIARPGAVVGIGVGAVGGIGAPGAVAKPVRFVAIAVIGVGAGVVEPARRGAAGGTRCSRSDDLARASCEAS